MRKIYTLLALLFVVAMGASAQKLYDAVGFGDDGQLTAITPGQTVVMKSAAATDAVFLNITDRNVVKIQDVINDYSLFQFEVASDTTFYLKSVAAGKYLEDPNMSSNVVRLTENKVRAAKFVVRNPYVYDNAAAVDTARKYNEEEYSLFTFTTDEIFGMEDYSWKMTAVTANGGYKWFSTNASWTQYYGSNTWEFYTVQEKSSLESLIALLNEYCGDAGEEALDIFIAGTDPGQVDEALIEEVHTAYLELEALVNESSEDDDANWAAYNRFLTAYEACKNGIHPMREGYFYFSNWRTESTAAGGGAIEDNAVYENESDHLTYWSWTSGWTRPEKPRPEDANYIYWIKDNGDGTFCLQNYGTKRWLGYVSGRNKKIPTTEEPEEKYQITIHPVQPGMFSVISCHRLANGGDDESRPAMHAAGDYNAIVFWTLDANASAWYFNEIPAADIQEMEKKLEDYKRLQALQELVDEAQATYNKGFSYTSDAETSSEYNEPGLVTDVEQLWTNADEPREGEGSLDELLDSDFTTFFHSRWSDLSDFEPADGGKYHNIIADLAQAVSAVDVKITKRMGSGAPANYANNAPYKVHFYTTNSIEETYDDDDNLILTSNDWHDQGVVMFSYPYSAKLPGDDETEYKNETGINSCAFDGEYRYVRMDVESRGNGATGWFNMSEIRFYEAKYDPTTSIIEAVPADKRQALEEAIKVAKDEILDEAATQETLDRLQAAYDAFVSVYPDPQRVLNLLEELRAQRDAAEEGTGLGYFDEGAKDELNTAITAVEADVKDVMSVQEVNAALETLNAAYAVFNSKLHMPADGSFLMIRSATSSEDSGSAADNYLYATGHGKSQIHWGGYSKTTGLDANINARLNYIWKAEKNEDGSYRFLNLATGRYIANQPLNNKVMTMAIDDENVDMTLRSAKVGGLFNIVQAEGVYANAQPGGNKNLVTWNSASGTDNSAFQFVPAEWDGTYLYDQISTTDMTPLTLPFEVAVPYADEATVYSVIGYKGNAEAGYNLILKAYAEDATIPAGTPFIVKMANENSGMFFFIEGANSLDQITYTFEPKAENGLNGTIDPVTLEPNCGIFKYGIVLLSEKDEVCPANSAYLTNIVPTEEDGDAQVVLENVPATGIFVISTERNANNVIFDLQGRRVINAQKGLYIINGKKVLVK